MHMYLSSFVSESTAACFSDPSGCGDLDSAIGCGHAALPTSLRIKNMMNFLVQEDEPISLNSLGELFYESDRLIHRIKMGVLFS